MQPKTIVFDLDDTLALEMDYLKSAFKAIASELDAGNELLFHEMLEWQRSKQNVFALLKQRFDLDGIDDLRNIYRNHIPDFSHLVHVREMLSELKSNGHFLGLITDGYSVTQRNKLRALQIEELFDLIVISEEFGSEKPHENNYRAFERFGTRDYIYVGDNTAKDFVTPNRLGWKTVCVEDSGHNIHMQDFNRDLIYLPTTRIKSLEQLTLE
ncbi:MAG: HAD family hydrolase [Flavobacterium sp.]|uniref:HAD family hydrolase n=1 Tax=Flavobacterium sp. TaxID=239 RepID=UPI0011F62257|nr:HAD family hydrolase [Flavobacterium sp.]RZJ66066.1 MAG: HAD family hydrolase [Flavobacterium sp.]